MTNYFKRAFSPVLNGSGCLGITPFSPSLNLTQTYAPSLVDDLIDLLSLKFRVRVIGAANVLLSIDVIHTANRAIDMIYPANFSRLLRERRKKQN
jgi:hypothetical protein